MKIVQLFAGEHGFGVLKLNWVWCKPQESMNGNLEAGRYVTITGITGEAATATAAAAAAAAPAAGVESFSCNGSFGHITVTRRLS
jgi:hypothetical protein